MAKKELSREEQKQQRLNRQINFLVMRRMWQKIRGRAEKGAKGQTIYAAFHMSRERYTRVVRGDAVRFSKDELKRLMAETGVRGTIFEGKDCFQFENISRKDWEKLFRLRDEDIKAARGYEKYLFEQIAKSDFDLLKNPDLFYFSSYLESGKPAIDLDIEENLLRNIQFLDSINIAQLERCRLEVLQEYLRVLERQVDAAGTLLHYVELKRRGQ